MQLNLDILQDYLCECHQVRRFGPDNKGAFYRRPLLYENGMEMEEGELYIARDSVLPQTPPPKGVGLICMGDRLPPAWGNVNAEVLCISQESSVLSLLNQVQTIYNRLDAWDEQLRDALEDNMDFDIGQMLVLGSRILENPINVVGKNLQTLFTTETEPDASGAFQLKDDVGQMSMNADYAAEIRKVCRLERNITVPYLTSFPLPDQQSYCNNLYPFGQFMGCISISSMNRPFRQRDFPLADHFFQYFQKAFLKYLLKMKPESSLGAAALGRLLNQEPLSVQERALFQLPKGEYWHCFLLREGDRAMLQDYMYGTLSALMSQTVFLVLRQGELIGLIRVQEGSRNSLENLEEILSRMGYTCGLSGRFTDIRKLAEYLLQARYVIESCQSSPMPTLSFFEDQILQYMLYECTGKLSVESLASPGLQALSEHDRNRGTEYVKTLDTYLKNEMSMTKTADALYIHRSSLLKRLNKIERIIQEDLTHPDVRLYYRIYFALKKRMDGI